MAGTRLAASGCRYGGGGQWLAGSATRTSQSFASGHPSTRWSASTCSCGTRAAARSRDCARSTTRRPRRSTSPPARGLWYCFSLRRGRRRHQVRAEDRRPVVRRGGRAAGRAGRRRAPLRAGRLRPGPGTEPAAQADRRAPGGRRILCRTAGRVRRRAGPRVPGRARLRARRRPAVRRRLLAEGLGGPDQAPARPGLHRQRADRRRAWPGRAAAAPGTGSAAG